MSKKQIIPIEMPIKTSLTGMNEVVQKLQDSLRDGFAQTDLTKGLGKNFSKLIDTFKKEYATFTRLTEGGGIDFSRSAEGVKAGKNLISTFEELQRVIGDLSTKSVFDMKKMFPEAFDSRLDDFKKSLNGLSDNLDKLAQKRLAKSTLEGDISTLEARLTALKSELIGEAEIQIKNNAVTETKKKVVDLKEQIDGLRASFKKELNLRLKTDDEALKKIKKDQEEIEARNASRNDFSGGGKTGRALRYKGKTESEWTKDNKDTEGRSKALLAIKSYRDDQEAYKKNKENREIIMSRREKLLKLQGKGEEADLGKLSQALEQTGAETSRAIDLQTKYAEAVDRSTEAEEALAEAKKQNATKQEQINDANDELTQKKNRLQELTNTITQLSKKADLSSLTKELASIEGLKDLSPELLKDQKGIDDIIKKIDELDEENCDKLIKEFEKLGLKADNTERNLEDVQEAVEEIGDGAKEIKRANDELESLKQQVLDFFSISNTVQLFKSTIQSALETVKELDATMTEAAMVTDFSVGDMWEKLPQYSKEAQKLGVSINSMYQATTLYYQQGLKNNEAMAIGAETMKMGKIAAMDSTEATKAMTSALRGFNMELNETSAVRVNDVYSQLAAVTAADTSQIATAMEKTASIAASANMEFETTAAFLSQIIETTQEAPETAGTALKTIIARFSEVKNLASQGLVSGQDSEGEVIDVNKIQTALRTVGISMDEYFAGTEGLDQVLLRLAEKWGTLNFETQRYIATMAAGSRQQSRFIAMMSDYGRTTELVSAANNSAGASQRQFEKTTESLQSSLTKLKNAWDEFSMGLANNEILKLGVDLLTGLLETINKITDAISGGNGLAKSVVSLITVIEALKGGKALLGGITGKLGETIGLGSYKETITEEQQDGKTIRTVIKQPYKEGKEVGIEAGRGLQGGIQEGATRKSGRWFKDIVVEQVPTTEYDRDALSEAIDRDLNQIEQQRWQTKITKRDKVVTQQVQLNREQKNRKRELEELKKAIDDTDKSTEELAKRYEKLGGKVSENNNILQRTTVEQEKYIVTTDSMARGVGKLGMAAAGAGTAIMLLGSALESLGEEEAAKAVQTIGAYVTGFGSLAASAPQMLDGMRSVARTLKMNTTTLASWVLVILAAVAAVIKIVDALKEFGEARDLSNKIDEVTQKISDLGDAADEAKEKITAIAEDRKEFDRLKDQFNGLTKGTKEWRQQLVKSNQEVFGLIEKYPQLSQYLLIGENGELSISDKGWDNLADQAQQQQAAAVIAQMSLQIQKNQLEQQQAFEKALSDSNRGKIERERAVSDDQFKSEATAATAAGVGAIGAGAGMAIGMKIGGVVGSFIPVPVLGTAIGLAAGALVGATVGSAVTQAVDEFNTEEGVERSVTGLTQKEFSNFAALASRSGLYMSTEGDQEQKFHDLYTKQYGEPEDWNKIWTSMQEMGEKFDELAAKTEALRLAQETYTQSMLSTAGQADAYLSGNVFFEQAVEGVSSAYGEQMNELTAELADTYTSEEYVDKDTGKPTEKLIEEYATTTGLKEDEIRAKIKDEALSAETMAQTVASKQSMDIAIGKMQKVAQELTKISFSKSVTAANKSVLKNALTDEGRDLTKADLKQLKNETGISSISELTKDKLNTYLGELGTSLENLGLDFQTFFNNLLYAEKELENAYSFFNERGYITTKLEESVNAATGLAFSKKIQATSLTASEEELKGFVAEIDKAVGEMDDTEAEKFMNALTGVDWTVTEQVDSLSETLEGLGVDLSKAGIDVESLEKQIKDMADAASGLSFREQAEQMKTLFAVGQSLASGTGSIKIAENQKNSLVTKGGISAEDFVQDPLSEKWVYQGSLSREGILEKIAQTTRDDYEAVINDANKADTWSKAKKEEIFGEQRIVSNLDAINAAKEHNATEKAKEGTKVQAETVITVTDPHTGMPTTQTYIVMVPYQPNYVEVPKETYGRDGATITAESIASGKTIIVDEIPNANDMEEGKSYVVVSNAKVLAENMGIPKEELQGQDAAGLTQLFQNYSKAGEKSSDGKLEDVAALAFYNADIDEVVATALSKQEVFSGENKVAQQALQDLTDFFELPVEAIELFTEKLAIAGYEQDKAKAMAIALTKRLQDLKEVYQITANSIGEYIEKLKELPKDSDEYQILLRQIGTSLTEMFGVNPGVEWIEDNMPLLQDFVNGVDGAYDQVGKIMSNFYLVNSGLTSEIQNGITQLIQSMDGQTATIVFTPDMFDLMAGVQFAQSQLNKVEQALLSAGYAISQWTEVEGSTEKWTIGGITRIDAPSIEPYDESAKSDKWENPYDVFYNTLQKINEASRERERLERRYQKLVEKGTATAETLSRFKKQELAALQAEAQLQNDIITGRKQQIDQHIQQEGLKKYVSVTKDKDTGYLKIRIDYEEIDSSGNSEIEEAIGKIEEWTESANDANDALIDIEDSVDEIKDRGKDEYLELEQTIKDALVESYQKQIDSLSDINDSINEANSKMIESMQQIISDERQARDNQRTEEEIADKQRRLAYLQQDTSGAHASEIMSLEKEIGDAQENYTDTLIDQKISELQQQNDEAAEQRERQIEIAQNQLDHWVKTGGVWEKVEKLMDEGLDPKEGLIRGERLEAILHDSANWEGMSKFEQLDWSKEINANIAEGLSWLRDYEAGETDIDLTKGSEDNSDMGNLKTNQPDSTENPKDPKEPQYDWRVANTQTILKDAKMYDGPIDGIHTEETEQAEKKYRSTYNLADSEDIVSHYQATGYKAVTGKEFPYEDPVFIDPNKRRTGYLPGSTTEFESSFGEDKNGVVWIFGGPNDTGALGTIWHNGKRIPINHYQTGGLADYTGPAWLDGTKSKPELVLNAQDTQNFIQLKNILASLKFGKVLEAEKNGDSVYDIDINVETIQNKEDLDMISKYIEDKIISSANYRNNNLIKINR